MVCYVTLASSLEDAPPLRRGVFPLVCWKGGERRAEGGEPEGRMRQEDAPGSPRGVLRLVCYVPPASSAKDAPGLGLVDLSAANRELF